MVEFILGAFLYAKLKNKYKLKYIFKSWSIYPPLLFALFYIFLEYTMYIQWYYFIPYAQMIKTSTLLSYVPLIVAYKLYENNDPKYINNDFLSVATSPMVKSGICLLIGSICNRIALFFNNNYMPTYPSISYWTKYIKPDQLFIDGIHIIGNPYSAAIPICNVLDIGFTVVSLGDLIIRFYVFLIVYHAIKNSNRL